MGRGARGASCVPFSKGVDLQARTEHIVVGVLCGLLAVGSAWATDIPVAGRKLIITDKMMLASRAKVVYVALDGGVTKGTGIDPATIDAAFEVRYAGTSVAGAFVLPAGANDGSDGWKANKSSVAKYINKLAPTAGPTDAKVSVIKPGRLLKIVGKSLGDTPIDILGGGIPPAGGVDTVYTVTNGTETNRHCTNFPQSTCAYKLIAAGTGAKLVCRNGAGSACPLPPTTTSTTLATSTSTSTSSTSSTTSSSTSSTTSSTASTSSTSSTSSSTSTSTSTSSSTSSSTTSTSTSTSSSTSSTTSSTTSTSTSSTTTTTAAPTCSDGIRNGLETDTDCGGPTCPDCAVGKTCAVNGDCVSTVCTGTICSCGPHNFTFTVNSNSGGLFDSAEWPGGTATQTPVPGCSLTINRPNDNIDLVCTLANPFSIQSFTGYSLCLATGGTDGFGCQPVSCPPAGVGSCCGGRPSCSAALNGSGSAQYLVNCLN